MTGSDGAAFLFAVELRRDEKAFLDEERLTSPNLRLDRRPGTSVLRGDGIGGCAGGELDLVGDVVDAVDGIRRGAAGGGALDCWPGLLNAIDAAATRPRLLATAGFETAIPRGVFFETPCLSPADTMLAVASGFAANARWTADV